MADALTEESFRRGMEAVKAMGDKADLERGERAREIRERGRRQSKLGQIVDSAYVNGGPLVMSPAAASAFSAFLEEEERRAAAGEEEQLSDDAARRIALASWGYGG